MSWSGSPALPWSLGPCWDPAEAAALGLRRGAQESAQKQAHSEPPRGRRPFGPQRAWGARGSGGPCVGPGGSGSGAVLATARGVRPVPCVPGRVCAITLAVGLGQGPCRGVLTPQKGRGLGLCRWPESRVPRRGPGHLRQPSIDPSEGRRAKSPRATRGHSQSLCQLPGQAPPPSRTKTVCASATQAGRDRAAASDPRTRPSHRTHAAARLPAAVAASSSPGVPDRSLGLGAGPQAPPPRPQCGGWDSGRLLAAARDPCVAESESWFQTT